MLMLRTSQPGDLTVLIIFSSGMEPDRKSLILFVVSGRRIVRLRRITGNNGNMPVPMFVETAAVTGTKDLAVVTN
jgi:hypothetical protein